MKIQSLVSSTRFYRKWHTYLGLAISVFIFVVALSGLLLIWKKNSFGYLQADTKKGTGQNPGEWMPVSTIMQSAVGYLKKNIPGCDTVIDRIDIRTDYGIAKVIFEKNYLAVQVDMATARPMTLEKRRSDLIEQIHDGSFIEKWIELKNFKLVYGTIIAFSLIFMTWSGVTLWYNPKKIRSLKSRKPSNPIKF